MNFYHLYRDSGPQYIQDFDANFLSETSEPGVEIITFHSYGV